ncbi:MULTISPECIES: ZIP family metal transporter [Pseudomonas]|jgi:Predicted divalent heavy-metal cations transporter|uniref:Putative transport-related membrane protein n=1 Tax=Pseudomonas brassicacearum (strain NFM421) TaxID=994484 RepID=F2KCF4_PSEBN|nr:MULTISPECIES: ZIP family metal transporter [Pseudomonas]EIK69962.1 metal cation transporter, zinc(II)-iron(II) permease (ZIP) family [Pseudomonas fluorescens Q8r1-96]KIR16363.1 Zinc transporter ZupT [Pseudomonas fluorescens]AEA67007.1 putative transport-related membrane protein [Pseudomonas brassicacearum subsp. brassicacearum NFM421]AOS39444.1 divalent cation transporter [Pseudomonas brassicacearum]KAB0525478.1 ZIP family metal transporter [Pseudomonas brassicacearum subsp. brassicacearum]
MDTQTLAIGSGRMFRYALGSLLLLAGMTLLAAQGLAWLDLEPRLLRALEGGGLCALGTALGAVPVLVIRRMPQAVSDSLLGFGAGVMLAATAFSLIVPGIAAAEQLGLTPWAASGLISFGILSGAFGLYLVDRKVCACPERLVAAPGRPIIAPRIWLFVFAIIAHNIPEGMAVGVSAGGGMPDADSLAMGIALQDVPEGLVIALVLAAAGMSRARAFLIGAASGLVEPVFALLCAWLVSLAEMLLPLGLALAAGAMLLVVTHEVIPESRRNGHEKLASLGLLVGFCLMMVLDTALA